ncbi:MAG: hypothetical protein M3356_02695 [Actinomycetota bacterium]|nr:hypothetical protein [Actinomycetota bacterium]
MPTPSGIGGTSVPTSKSHAGGTTSPFEIAWIDIVDVPVSPFARKSCVNPLNFASCERDIFRARRALLTRRPKADSSGGQLDGGSAGENGMGGLSPETRMVRHRDSGGPGKRGGPV